MTTAHRSLTFDGSAAHRVLVAAAAVVGIESDDAELVRLGDHAVFRLGAGSIIARVGRDSGRLVSVRREVAVGRWLASNDFPVPGLVGEEQPVVVDGHPVTFWEAVGDGKHYATPGEMGECLRRLHALPAPGFPLPPLRPFETVQRRIDRAGIASGTKSFLRELAADLEAAYADLPYELPPGHLHGDFNVGNVLLDDDGAPKVIDLDAFVTGPREWDLMQTAMYYDSYGWHTAEEYEAYARSYGFDILKWDGYPTLRSVRELLMITWLSQNAATDPSAAREVEHRVYTIRTGASRRSWAPF